LSFRAFVESSEGRPGREFTCTKVQFQEDIPYRRIHTDAQKVGPSPADMKLFIS
jgi:hypothetical protein